MKRTTPLSYTRLVEASLGAKKGGDRLTQRAEELYAVAEALQKELDDRFYT